MATSESKRNFFTETIRKFGLGEKQSNQMFRLTHTFKRVPDFFHSFEALPLEERARAVKEKLQALIEIEYLTAAQEMKGFRLYTNVTIAEVDRSGKIINARDPRYGNVSIIEQCKRSVEFFRQQKGSKSQLSTDRFEKEGWLAEQSLHLISQFVDTHPHAVLRVLDGQSLPSSSPKELEQDMIPPGWKPYKGKLPKTLTSLLPENTTTPAIVGPKYIFSMPATKVYAPDDEAFMSAWQVGYHPELPEDQQFFVLNHQLKRVMSFKEMTRMMEATQDTSQNSPVKFPTYMSEEALMGFVLPMAEEFQELDTEEAFTLALEKIGLKTAELAIKQQAAIGEFRQIEEQIPKIADAVSTIMIAEYLQGEDELTPNALDFIHELALKAIGHNGNLDTQAALTQYQSMFKGPQRLQTKTISKHQQRQQFFLELVGRASSQKFGLLELAAGFDCIGGSFNAIQQVAQLQAPSFASSMGLSPTLFQSETGLRSHAFTSEHAQQVEQLVGAQRFKDWKIGACINPTCPHRGRNDIYVGECGICLSCELLDNLGALGLSQKDTDQNSAVGEQGQHNHDAFSSTKRIGVDAFIGASLLFAYEDPFAYLIGQYCSTATQETPKLAVQ